MAASSRRARWAKISAPMDSKISAPFAAAGRPSWPRLLSSSTTRRIAGGRRPGPSGCAPLATGRWLVGNGPQYLGPGPRGRGERASSTSAQSVPLATARSERRSSANCARSVVACARSSFYEIRQAPASQVGQVFFVDREQVGHRACSCRARFRATPSLRARGSARPPVNVALESAVICAAVARAWPARRPAHRAA